MRRAGAPIAAFRAACKGAQHIWHLPGDLECTIATGNAKAERSEMHGGTDCTQPVRDPAFRELGEATPTLIERAER
eukprot:5661482-Prymnesium_polylepis.1